MTLIDGDRIVTAQLYDDEYEEFTEKKMSIIDFVNKFADEGITKADDVLDKIRAEIVALKSNHINDCYDDGFQGCRTNVLQILDKYKAESEE